MSALASSPELSQDSPGSDFSEANLAPKRKKRQNFSGLTPQQKAQAKKANNRQAAQNLRDRKKQQEDGLADKVAGIEASNQRLAAQLAQLEEENKALQDEARMFAKQHFERFQLQGLAKRLMRAVQADPGNGQNITSLLAAMGTALEAPASPASVIALSADSPLTVAAAEAPLLAMEEDVWSAPDCGGLVDDDVAPPQPMAEGSMEPASPPLGPVDLSEFPELPADLFLDLLPQSPAAVPDRDVFSALSDPHALSPSLSPSVPATHPSPLSALPELSPESVRIMLAPFAGPAKAPSVRPAPLPTYIPTSPSVNALSTTLPSPLDTLNTTLGASKRVQPSNSSVAAGAWPAVPPLPSGLQQLLMVLICTSLTRLSQAPVSLPAPAPGPVPLTISSPISKRQPGSSACAIAALCSSRAHCAKEYGLARDKAHTKALSPSVF